MKTSYIIFISVFCLFILIGIVVFYVQNSSKGIGNSSKVKDECIQVPSDERYNCYISVAVNNNDSSACDKIQDPNPNMKDLCYAQVASMSHDPVPCEKIQEPNLKNQCLATSKNDTSYCANVREDMKEYPCSS